MWRYQTFRNDAKNSKFHLRRDCEQTKFRECLHRSLSQVFAFPLFYRKKNIYMVLCKIVKFVLPYGGKNTE